ncbi:IS200/IS605 family transposase [Akkermansiaceae bacterium]|nr:IS200/IS605 family transposase [Akkermansiaceae bacterium]
MPQSLAKVLVHLVFSTKDREPVISEEIQPKLHAYLAGTLDNISCTSLQVGGVDDHAHLFFALGRTITIAKVVEECKTASSKWMKSSGGVSPFTWQSGYGIFSISESQREQVIAYVKNQKDHHKELSFKDEFRILCERYHMTIDERYVWD